MSTRKKIGNILLILLGILLISAGWFIDKIEQPAFQTELTQRVVRYLAKKTDSEMSIGHVRLKFFNSVELNDVLIRDRYHDTLIAAKLVEVQFNIISLLHNKYSIDYITLDQAHVYLHRPLNDTNWNYQFLIDALSSDEPSTGGSSKLELTLGKMKLNQTHFVMYDEPNIIRLDFSLPAISIDVNNVDFKQPKFDLAKLVFDHADFKITKTLRTEIDTADFPQPDTAVVHINTKSIQLFVSDLQFVDSRFTYDDLNEPVSPQGFDGMHQQYNHLNFHITNGSWVLDTIKAHIENISMQEKSGFVLNHMEADARVTPSESKVENLKIETPNSVAKDFFSFTYTNFHAFLNFNEEVILNAKLNHADISMKDLSYFFKGTEGISESFLADGTVRGTIDNMKAKDLKLQAGNNTRFAGNIEMKGLPAIDETYINLKVNELVTNSADIQRWIPGTKLPAEVSRLGTTRFKGSFSGFINDFVAYGVFNTQLGQITSDLNMKFTDEALAAQYSGNLSTSNFNLGTLTAQDSVLGTISFALNLNGRGLKLRTMNAKMSGTVQQIQFLGYNYQNAAINGTLDSKVFTGSVNMRDENVRIAFNGAVDMNADLPVYNFKAKVDSANLQALKFSDDFYLMSMKLDMNMSGNNIDDFLGSAKATEIVFSNQKSLWHMDTLSMLIDKKVRGNGRKMILSSPIARARFDGEFALTKLPRDFLAVIDHYFPALPGNYPTSDTLQDFDFKILLVNVSGAEKFFLPELAGMDSTKIEGHFNSALNDISFLGNVRDLSYKDMVFGDVYLSAQTKNDSFRVSAGSHELIFSDSMKIIDPLITVVMNNNVATLLIKGTSPDHRNYLNLLSTITGDYSQLSMHILPSDMVLNGRAWKISEDNLVTYSDERLIFQNFSFTNEDRSLTVQNVNLRVRATNLQFGFKNIPIGDLHEFITWNSVDLEGSLNGTLEVLNVFHAPRFIANTVINNFSANGSKVALVTSLVSYIPEDDRLSIEIQLSDPQNDVIASGTFYPRRETDQLNLDVEVRKANVQLVEALFFEDFISNTTGSASGKLSMTGNPDKPVLTGLINISELSTKINYLQTTYRCFNTPVVFKEGSIEIGKLTLFDENNDSAQARGQIFHDHLNDWSMNIAITTKKFLALNTTEKDDSIFYGTAIASGIIQFLGPVDQMEIRASVTSQKGTNISVPVSDGGTSGQRSFIRYVNKKQQNATVNLANGYQRLSGLTLSLNLEITPAAEIQIIFDAQTGDIIKGSGTGSIRMDINTKGDFSMYGTFTIEKGNYLFTQFNFFNKYFTIENGGTIVWSGDPYGAVMNLSAVYSTKTSLIELVPQASSLSDQEIRELQQRYKVDLYLKLTGLLFSPEISFDIRLPEVSTASSTANIELQRLKQDENELNKQAFGLIVLGHFLPASSSSLGGQSIGTDVNNTLSGFISSQINSLASQIWDDVDVSVNYQSYEANVNASDPNNLVKRNELQLALTKRFFNDRLAVDVGGNFDFGQSSETATQSTNGITGDFSVEYKMTPDGRISGKVFSTSDYDVVDERNKTKNGISIKYTRDFDTLKELFSKAERQKRKEIRRQLKQQEKIAAENPPPTTGK